MDGLLILDKPRGPTCQQILSRFRRAFPKTKVGYTGTLDPFATGVLPIFIGAATKLIPYIEENRKTYEALLKLGEETDTLDCEGKVVKTTLVPDLAKEDWEKALKAFVGKRFQTPPQFSAIKVKGTPLYRWARKGVEVEVEPRAVEIFSLEILSWEAPFLKFSTEVSRGTYIRSLAAEMAESLGSLGHLTELKRLKSGAFDLGQSITLENFEKRMYDTQDYDFIKENLNLLIKNFKQVSISNPQSVKQILQGQTVCLNLEEETSAGREGERVLTLHRSEILSISEIVFSKGEGLPLLKPLRILQLSLS